MKIRIRILPLIIVSILLLFAKELIACPPPPPPHIPVAIISGSPNTTFIGDPINLYGGLSQPDCQSIYCYEWDFHYDGTFNTEQTTPWYYAIASYSYSAPGTYTIALRVQNYPCFNYSIITSECLFTVTVTDTIYVNKGATGSNNGRSWADAFTDLQSALNVAISGVQIWVAQGTYNPTTSLTDSNASFVLKPNIALYGGFTGNETSVAERDWVNHHTILSGDIAGNDNLPIEPDPYSDNSYNIVRGANGAVLDGFVITGGIANYLLHYEKGGGMFNDGVSPFVRNCEFMGNWAIYGGAVYNNLSSSQITNCIFSDNGALYAGAIYNNYSNTNIVGCSISLNGAADCGGIYNSNSNPGVINCIIYGNTGGSFTNVSASVPYISYSDIEGCKDGGAWVPGFGINGGHNLATPPLFSDDELHLQPGSPCIATGVDGQNMGFNWPTDATILNSVEVSNPVDLAVNSNGDVYVLSSSLNSSQVLIYDAQLSSQGSFTLPTTKNPKGIALDSSGRVYITDTENHRILRYVNNGGSWGLDSSFGTGGVVGAPGTDDGQFDQPWGIDVDLSGFVYVTDSGNHRVQVFNSSGAFERNWGESGSGDGQFNTPSGLCSLANSNLFIADTSNNRIQNISGYGTFYWKMGSYGSGNGQFSSPRDICYDLIFNEIIIADTDNDRIQIFQIENGSPVFMKNIDNLNLSSPKGVARAFDNTAQIIYVAHTGYVVRLKVERNQPARGPLYVWESMKGALRMGNNDMALTFFSDISRDQYSQIFDFLGAHLQDYVNSMGQMELSSQKNGENKYLMSHQHGIHTYLFPVFFIQDENGDWKILKF